MQPLTLLKIQSHAVARSSLHWQPCSSPLEGASEATQGMGSISATPPLFKCTRAVSPFSSYYLKCIRLKWGIAVWFLMYFLLSNLFDFLEGLKSTFCCCFLFLSMFTFPGPYGWWERRTSFLRPISGKVMKIWIQSAVTTVSFMDGESCLSNLLPNALLWLIMHIIFM